MLSLIHISEPTRQEAISYAVFCLKKKSTYISITDAHQHQQMLRTYGKEGSKKKGRKEGREDRAAHLCSISGPNECGNSLVHVGGDVFLRRH